jgi:hypothetical protein
MQQEAKIIEIDAEDDEIKQSKLGNAQKTVDTGVGVS